MKRVTVFTPTYNRANVLYRVFDSLEALEKWLEGAAS